MHKTAQYEFTDIIFTDNLQNILVDIYLERVI